jgi:hypothetical protein
LSFNFPRISMVQPKIRNLNLVTILNQLFENSIIIPNSISPSGYF